MKILSGVILLFLIIFSAYSIWVLVGVPKRDSILSSTSISKDATIIIGTDVGKGNILGIQPYLTAMNYSNIPTFKQSIRAYLVEAKKNKLINTKTVVVLPEHIGSFLFAYEEKESVYAKSTLEEALKAIVSANIFKYGLTYLLAPSGINRTKYAALAFKSNQSAKLYLEIFGGLAKEFNVTIAAGSIILPDATLSSTGIISTKNGSLYNTTVIFNKDGKVTSELQGTLLPIEDLSGFMKSLESSVSIFNKDDETAGWRTYLPNSISLDTSIHNGMAISLAGQLWDKKLDGRTLIIQNGISTVIPTNTTGRIINLWVN